MVKKRRGRSKKGIDPGEPEEVKKAPHSFVIKRGKLGKHGNQLMMDIRKVMEPNTAANLKVKKNNVIKDFVAVASIFNVTHLIVLTRTSKSMYIKYCRVPHGPTLVFKVEKYSLARDVISSLRKPVVMSNLHIFPPLLVMNGFDQTETDLKSKMITTMFQGLFPPIDVKTVKLTSLKRVVLINLDKKTGLLEYRHYAVRLKPVGISKPIKKLVCGKRLPNLGSLASVEDIFEKNLAMSESEGEGLDEVEEVRHVKLSQTVPSRGNILNEKSAIRLTELGPRMTLKLVRIEDGLLSGNVLFKYSSTSSSSNTNAQ